jgi:NAD(P)H dehydrogenase (quinone)
MFVILGGTGKVGGATARELRRGGHPVRIVARTSARTDDLSAIGCEIAVADIRDSETLTRAIAGAAVVQVICPTNPKAADPWGEMEQCIRSMADALSREPPPAILAISDYGAEISEGSGITLAFHDLEEALKALPIPLTILRSCEQMQNWQRSIGPALALGVLPSLHDPVTKLFPTVSATDVGLIAANLLVSGNPSPFRLVHVEGPQRYSANDVALILSAMVGRRIVAKALPRSEWVPSLERAGISTAYANLVAEMFVAHNAGRIDVEAGSEVRHGETPFDDVLTAIVNQESRDRLI